MPEPGRAAASPVPCSVRAFYVSERITLTKLLFGLIVLFLVLAPVALAAEPTDCYTGGGIRVCHPRSWTLRNERHNYVSFEVGATHLAMFEFIPSALPTTILRDRLAWRTMQLILTAYPTAKMLDVKVVAWPGRAPGHMARIVIEFQNLAVEYINVWTQVAAKSYLETTVVTAGGLASDELLTVVDTAMCSVWTITIGTDV